MFSLRTLTLPLLLATALIAGCNSSFKDDSKVLASVNGDDITENDFQHYKQLRAGQQGPIGDSEKENKVVLDEMIDRTLLAQQGASLGYENTPEVHFRLKRIRENLLAQEVVRNTMKDVSFTDDEVKARFAKELEDTHKTEYRARHILVKTEDDAKKIADDLKAGKKFEQLAKANSMDPGSKDNGGALGDWINQGSGLVPEFFDALKTLKKGETSAPVKSEFGWHLIKVDETRALKLPTVEQFMSDPRAPQTLRRRMQEEKLQAVLKDLKEKAKLQIN